MFDAEKLLGGLLGSGMDRQGLGSTLGNLASPGKASVAMGLLGVAMAAFEHFTEDRSSSQGQRAGAGPAPGGPPPPPGATPPPPTGAAPPPPPGAPASSGPGQAPPPPPGATPGRPPAAPPAPPAGTSTSAPDTAQNEAQNEARLYIRGMIAAAAADGVIDAQEREKILDRLEQVGLDEEERAFLLQEMATPAGLDELLGAVRDPQQAMNLYVCSLLAVEVDTDAERDYLRRLAAGLQLAPDSLQAVHDRYQVAL